MKPLALYQIDAFTDTVFGGNPAAVCPLNEWLPDSVLQKIALENNLSETAFFIPHGEDFHLRWFTPTSEIDLCGHATLATAFVIFEHLAYPRDRIKFSSRSGVLTVARAGKTLTMDFPQWEYTQASAQDKARIETIIGIPAKTVLKSKTVWAAVLDSAQTVKTFKPDIPAINTLPDVIGLVITAPGTGDHIHADFVSRFFAPQVGIDEDPVTGATHCLLTPYWGETLGKTELTAQQLSVRGGDLTCKLTSDNRVEISGRAVLYLKGNIYV